MPEHESDWFPGRTSKLYSDHYDDIKWDSIERGIAQKGKAKLSTSSRMLHADENLKAVRTPIGQRTDKTFRHID